MYNAYAVSWRKSITWPNIRQDLLLLRNILTILVSVSLFVPGIAKMMAYVDCTFVAITYSNPSLCDCNRIIDNDLLPSSPDMPDKQKQLSLKADWKYTVLSPFRLPALHTYRISNKHAIHSPILCAGHLSCLLRPPIC